MAKKIVDQKSETPNGAITLDEVTVDELDKVEGGIATTKPVNRIKLTDVIITSAKDTSVKE